MGHLFQEVAGRRSSSQITAGLEEPAWDPGAGSVTERSTFMVRFTVGAAPARPLTPPAPARPMPRHPRALTATPAGLFTAHPGTRRRTGLFFEGADAQ